MIQQSNILFFDEINVLEDGNVIIPSGGFSSLQGQELIDLAKNKYAGTPYAQMDCSHFVNSAYSAYGLKYPYVNVAGWPPKGGYFAKVNEGKQPGDVRVLYDVKLGVHHMGLYDPNETPNDWYDATSSKGVKAGSINWFNRAGAVEETIWRWNK